MTSIQKLCGNKLLQDLDRDLQKTKSIIGCRQLINKYIGKNGWVGRMNQEKKIPFKDQQYIKNYIKTQIEKKKEEIEQSEDLTYEVYTKKGKSHLITNITNRIKSIARFMNFKLIQGKDITDEFLNFESLGMGTSHPARSEQQTFFLSNNKLLRTHTSALQNQAIKSGVNRAFAIGKVYRRDSDATHTYMFHQVEFIAIGPNCSLENLFKFIRKFIASLFSMPVKIMFRPNYFPFTTPSYEVDIMVNGKWVEILGCGLIAPIVFEKASVDNKQGWAMGIGLERLLILMDDVSDIRSLYY